MIVLINYPSKVIVLIVPSIDNGVKQLSIIGSTINKYDPYNHFFAT